MRAAGRECVSKKLPPPPLFHTTPPSPSVHLRPTLLGGAVHTQTNVFWHLVQLMCGCCVLVRRGNLRQTYIGNTYVYKLQRWQRHIPLAFIFRFMVAQGNIVPLGARGNHQNIRNPLGIPPVNTTYPCGMETYTLIFSFQLLNLCLSPSTCSYRIFLVQNCNVSPW